MVDIANQLSYIGLIFLPPFNDVRARTISHKSSCSRRQQGYDTHEPRADDVRHALALRGPAANAA
jgi:hypothetical protein